MDIETIFISLILLLALISLTVFFCLILYALIFGAPFAPLADNRIKSMLQLLKPKTGDKFVDLGSGDGRIVIAFAKLGIESHGYEINPVLVAISRLKIRRLNLQHKAFIHFKDFWMEDLSKFNLVALYGIAHMMGRLEKKLLKELKPGSKIVANYFKFPHLVPVKKENNVWFYRIS